MNQSLRDHLESDTLLGETQAAQLRAADPEASAWVAANAGAGKTHVLKMRVLRLLLAGAQPERILCLTYTKAAAAEMAERIFRDLAEWATMADDRLQDILGELLERAPNGDDLRSARQLFARAIETPGGLKIQTVHAFCERLLQRFPLEANVPPGFAILDDAMAASLLRQSVDATLDEANNDPDGWLSRCLNEAVAFAADQQFDEILAMALKKRDWINAYARLAGSTGRDDQFSAALATYCKAFGLEPGTNETDLARAMAAVISDAQCDQAINVLATGTANDVRLSDALRLARNAPDTDARCRALGDVFLTKAGEPRAETSFITKKMREAEPGLTDTLYRAKSAFANLHEQRRRLRIANATRSLLVIADRVMRRYREAKSVRAALDFDDLIVYSASLLDNAEAAAWVLYKLDGGLDHVLVDEAQDTSPLQWRVIECLVGEFFAGQGVRWETEDTNRSIFAVGDEKQSIYSFQGAAPELFATNGRRFRAHAEAIRRTFRQIPLKLSFRTTAPLLDAVDRIFADHDRTPGLSAGADAIRHFALRQGQAGRFEMWETEQPEEPAPVPAFAPLDEKGASSPITRLAERIANLIEHWLQSGERLASEGRPIRAGDVLILVRKRQPFAGEMVRALKARRIPVAGADRILLANHVAVQDLMALADFLLLPEDDLSLAHVLKSPIFALDDDDLLTFAPNRPGLLWTALLRAAQSNPRLAEAAATLKRWRAQADFSPPFEFFANLLDRDSVRTRMLVRLGPEAGDAIDEFINLALAYDDQAPPSLQGFITWLREGRREVKRDMEHGRDEVRVMTVHGAKGLEAPIVFLPDTCTAAGGGRPEALAQLTPNALPPALVPSYAWAIKGAGKSAPIAAARSAEQEERQAEHNRLLYVALTRARDRVYVAGFEGKSGIAPGSWYHTIQAGIEDITGETADTGGRRIWRIESPQSAKPESAARATHDTVTPQAPPAWARRPAPREPVFTVPLAPSQIGEPVTDDEGEWTELSKARDDARPPLEPPARSPFILSRDIRLLRGNLTHALLEHLPDVATADRMTTARQFLSVRAGDIVPGVQGEIIKEVFAILEADEFSEAFGPGSRAEVAIAADIPNPCRSGPSLQINGQIDRLVQRTNDILIIDYKSNRRPPESPAGVPEAYLLQLAAYRLAVRQIFTGENVRAAILWTDAPLLMPLPSGLLDQAELRLWEIAM